MASVTFIEEKSNYGIPSELKKGKRNLTDEEIAVLVYNRNRNSDPTWKNILVSENPGDFNPELIFESEFRGWTVLGRMKNAKIKFHDLELETGIYHSCLANVLLGDDCVVRNVTYLENYRIGDRVMLFNIQEMSCTNHSKFGNGILKKGEPESNRVWIGVGNENGNRSVLPFESMIAADAYIWSRYRDDKLLQEKFLELTEYGNSKKLDTFGTVGNDAVIKNSTLLKDAKIGASAYIKGAFKLKNITVLSSEEEPSQIGEGVELVNGIMGYGSRAFYQAVAVRFVIGRNCQLKYGARLLNSVLGDNSTISCCECLNNLIFPFHEQHHNSSFLIASTVCGQSNIASGATIGSNHNSRSPDGEMFAGRGFWPGLCSDFKHNSYFASFVLVAKGSYTRELNIRYPFSLVACGGVDEPLHIIPAYWFLYNMYAIARNRTKFLARDKRLVKVQHIETDPFAPDTMQEILVALNRLIELTGRYLIDKNEPGAVRAETRDSLLQIAKDYLHHHPEADFELFDRDAQKKCGARIFKPVKAYKEYRKILKYYAVNCLMDYCKLRNISALSENEIETLKKLPLYTKWVNVGGQVLPEERLNELFDQIKSGAIQNWQQVHAFYDDCQSCYGSYKIAYALYLLEWLYSRSVSQFTKEIYTDIEKDVIAVSDEIYDSVIISRMKDFDDDFRMITFRNSREMDAVIGSIGTVTENNFLSDIKKSTREFKRSLKLLFKELCGDKEVKAISQEDELLWK